MEKHVVIIYAHPDDESFGAAGTINQFRDQGVPVTFLCGTLGEMGRNMGSPTFANRETLPLIREQELADACDVLDIDYQLLGYRDKTIEYEDIDAVAGHIKGILEKIKPSLVITHYPPYAIHPDHNALGVATIEAVRSMAEKERPTLWAQAIELNFEQHLGKPDIVHDVTNIFDEKLEAIFAHKSQAYGMFEQMKGDAKEVEKAKQALMKRLGKEQFYIWNFNE